MKKTNQGLVSLFKPYQIMVVLLALLSLSASGIALVIPKIISQAIDSYTSGTFNLGSIIFQFGSITLAIFVVTFLQGIAQVYVSERVAYDLREKLIKKISVQSHAYIQQITHARLLTNLTADVESIKMFIAHGIASLASSIIIIIGASILLLLINWKLAAAVLAIVPIITLLFNYIFRRVKPVMLERSEAIDWLNKIIKESILGSALVRILNSQQLEYEKFIPANEQARNIGLKILKIFASIIPLITFVGNLAMLIILVLGGRFVVIDSMTIGDFTAFNSYIALLIFPLFVIGMVGTAIAQASAAHDRLKDILENDDSFAGGSLETSLRGDIELKNISIAYGDKIALNDVSLQVAAGSRTAIIGPTAAGKTQMLYALIGLITPTGGSIFYDGQPITEYDLTSLYQQVGFVFQDSAIFNLTLRENIAFSASVDDAALHKAIQTAELDEFIKTLPKGLDTIVSEHGSSLSGGQKQRVMLARALAINPKVLLLDDFTSRVDSATEQKIINNIIKNYPRITLLSVTQKISSIESYDQIILMMEGELLARGRHQELLNTCPEYVQIYNSQKSTNQYE